MITAVSLIVGWLLIRRHVKRLKGLADHVRTIRNKI
jgi:hypothetical protein